MSENNWASINENLCRKCFIRIAKPSKKEIKGIVLTDYDDICENCGRKGPVVEYVEEDE